MCLLAENPLVIVRLEPALGVVSSQVAAVETHSVNEKPEPPVRFELTTYALRKHRSAS